MRFWRGPHEGVDAALQSGILPFWLELCNALCVVMVMMVVVVMVVSRSHHLRLRRDWSREAEDSNQSEQNLLHVRLDADSQVSFTRWVFELRFYRC